jgi:predicted O-methyltransferase YrrM
MTAYIVQGVVVLLLAAAVWRLRHYRAKFEQTGLLGHWPIKPIAVGDVDPLLKPGDLGPSLGAETVFLPGVGVLGGISDLETWVLTALAKKSSLIFEFGTCTGKTTYLLARNAPPDAKIVTLTLGPEQSKSYQDALGDAPKDQRAAHKESIFERFFYTDTPVQPKVVQLLGDSKAFDESAYVGQCDLVFVDGSHAASYVESDSRKALRMVRQGGYVFWHDYRGPGRAPGVYRTLNTLSHELPLRHIEKTSLVFYHAPLLPLAERVIDSPKEMIAASSSPSP